jgi:hypothetical protein
MKRAIFLLALFTPACGDNDTTPGLDYTNPQSGGKLRLVKNDKASVHPKVVLDLVVGDQTLTGFSAGFDLPLDATKVTLTSFVPGSVLDAGSAPVAAKGVIATSGPLAGMLVTGQSQKASASANDATLAPAAVLYELELDLRERAEPGVVFDGTATSFALPSGGLRDRVGTAVVQPNEVSIGKLVVR